METPAAAHPGTPVPGAQTWHVLVNNVSPDGENWSFNTFYPDHLRAHPGDAIVFTLAPNPNAFHTVMVLNRDLTPLELYEGFAGGFVRPLDPSQPDRLQSTYFGTGLGPPPCGRAGQDPCPFSTRRPDRIRGQLRRPRQPAAGQRPGQHQLHGHPGSRAAPRPLLLHEPSWTGRR